MKAEQTNRERTCEIKFVLESGVFADTVSVFVDGMESGEQSPLQALLVPVLDVDAGLRTDKQKHQTRTCLQNTLKKTFTFLFFKYGGRSM